jgi:hypothetical protein
MGDPARGTIQGIWQRPDDDVLIDAGLSEEQT